MWSEDAGPPGAEPGAREVLDALGFAAAVLDAKGVILASNAAWADDATTWGAPGQHHLDSHRRADVHEIDLVLDEGIQRVLDGRLPRFELEYPVERTGGRTWHLLIATPVLGRTGFAVVAHLDVTLQHDIRDLFDARAHRDPLTGLPNRRHMTERLANAVNRARRETSAVSVVFLDLDGFKGVNDGFGHEVGDEVLTAVSRRLAGTIRSDDVLGRWGGDEFVVVVDGGEKAVRSLASRLHAAMAQPIAVSGARSIGLHLSIGAAQARPGDGPDDVVARADMAMYEAKRSGEPLVLDSTGSSGPEGPRTRGR